MTYTASDSSWLITNAAGDEVAFYGYDAFGKLAFGTPASPFGYAGQYTDPSTGFSDMRARWYAPQTGEFTTRDPAFTSTDTAYAYAGNDPINQTDAYGLCTSFNFSCDMENNSWMDQADASPNGQVSVTETQAFEYLVDNNWSPSRAQEGVDSFDWSRPVTMIHYRAGNYSIKYASSGTNAGRRFWTTYQIFTVPALAVSALKLPSSNNAHYAWMIEFTADDPVLYGYVGGGWGLQYLDAEADTDTAQAKALPTPSIWLLFTSLGYHVANTLGPPGGPSTTLTSSGSGGCSVYQTL
jgi:RHS repeat-associated protein